MYSILLTTDMPIPVLSFFTGGGLLDIGFEQAGFDVVWTNEIVPEFVEMYAAGMTSWRQSIGNTVPARITTTQSIHRLTKGQILKKAFPEGVPAIFGMVGGPPCQDFSLAGQSKGFRGGRGRLTRIYLQKIKNLRPAFFVMENVEGLDKIKRHKKRLALTLEPLRKEYHIDQRLLNALEFGLPQDRRRLFIVGFRKDLLTPEGRLASCWPAPAYPGAETTYKWPNMNKFGGHPKKPKQIPECLFVQSCLVKENSSVANANEFFNAYSNKFKTTKEGDTHNQSFKRLHRYRYSPTACYGNNEVHLHPYKARRLSVREVLRIQGVPDAYVLPPFLGEKKRFAGLTHKYKMIGNGVPVPLAESVARSVADYINLYLRIGNGHLVKEEEKRSNVQNPVEKHKAGADIAVSAV
jgi:DNA (cytosine-5)-methyltransferase 1